MISYHLGMDLRLATIEQKNESSKKLTLRELEYLSLVALGFKNPVIAQILFVSFSTVKKTLESIFRKIKAKDRANAVAICFSHEILTVKSINEVFYKYEFRIREILEKGNDFK